jgi:hypothetical protein
MKFSTKTIAFSAALALCTTTVYFAQATAPKAEPAKAGAAAAKPAAKAVDHSVTGKIVSMTDTKLVINTGKKDLNLMFDTNSQKLAKMAVGNSVTVHYRTDSNKQDIVTSVQEGPAAPAAAAKKSAAPAATPAKK